MKRVIALVLSAVILMCTAAGCIKDAKVEYILSTPAVSTGVTGFDILDTLERKLSPVSDQFRIDLPEKVKLTDETRWSTYITDSITGSRYRVSIGCTPTGEAQDVLLHASQGTRTELNFALLSYYLYKSIGLSGMDADAFYEHFDMLTNSPSGELSEDGWHLHAHTSNGLLTFMTWVE